MPTFFKRTLKRASIALGAAAICFSATAEAKQTNQNEPMHIERTQSHVQTSRTLPYSAAAVWKLIAGFNTLPDYHAAVPKSRLAEGGAVRYITISEEAGGGIVVERLMYFNEEQKAFSYKIIGLIESPLPLHNYQAWVMLEPLDEHSCKLNWSSKFNAQGASKDEAEAIVRAIYEGCYDGIERVLSQR